jgi:parallel beta-helix repeat protein
LTQTNLKKANANTNPTMWIVAKDGSGNFTSISEAIYNESVSNGDTIFVRSATYFENIVINKSISLIGEDPNKTVIKGNGTYSVIFVNSNNVTIANFTVTGSGMRPPDSAIYVNSSSEVVIKYNKIIDNNNGISFYSSVNNLILGNVIANNSFPGIFAVSTRDSFISSNFISGNMKGIAFYISTKNHIVNNTVNNSKEEGIYLDSSSSSIIYHNNFHQNAVQTWSNMANVWDYEGEGNYWSDYNGSDFFTGFYQNETGSDGIGDTPYIINANNRDNFPLMGPFYAHDVYVGGEEHQVSLISNSTISNFSFKIGQETGNRMLNFSVAGEDGSTGFCRVSVPTRLMNYTLVLLVDGEEAIPTFLNLQRESYRCIYFTYNHSVHVVTIISSKELSLYNELLAEYIHLMEKFVSLNESYLSLLDGLSLLMDSYAQLQSNYTELYKLYRGLLLKYDESLQNLQNLTYAFLAAITLFIAVIIYLSKRAHMIRSSSEADMDKTG